MLRPLGYAWQANTENIHILLEAVSKPQIALKGKAQADEKAEHTREYVSILKRPATPSLSVRWGFEAISSGLSASYPRPASPYPRR